MAKNKQRVNSTKKCGRSKCSMDYLMILFNSKCFYCDCAVTTEYPKSRKLQSNAATRDHYTARSVGGDNKVENIVLCCNKCNSDRSNLLPEIVFKDFNLEAANKRLAEILVLRQTKDAIMLIAHRASKKYLAVLKSSGLKIANQLN